MKTKNPFLFTLVLLVIGGLMVLVKFQPKIFNKEVINFFAKDINKFCINNVCLEQDNNSWYIIEGNSKIPADEDMVKIYKERFEQIRLNVLVSRNPDKYNEFGIGGNDKVVLEINNKKLEIGRITNETDGTYVKDENARDIYYISTILDKNNLSNSDYWYLRNLSNMAKSEIKKVVVLRNGKNIELTPDKNGTWNNEQMIDKLINLVRVKYLPDFKFDSKNEYKFEVQTDSNNFTISVGQSKIGKDSIYWASLDKIHFFEISKNDFDLLTQKLN